jgi:hypothetical protein
MVYTLSALLSVSIIINMTLIYYAIQAARRLSVVSSNLEGMQESFTSFKDHVQALNELEMYYGDESLQNLMDHSREVLIEIDKCEDIYTLIMEEDVEDDVGDAP